MLNTRYKTISYIFTPQEKLELLTYEILSIFEISKRKLEWFIYGLIILIWLGVAYCFAALSNLSNPYKTLNKTTVLEVPKEQPISIAYKINYSEENVYNEITKISKSELKPEEIYSKVEQASKDWNINKFFLLALLEKECNFSETAIARDFNKTGSVGWSQATRDTWDTFNSQYVWKTYGKTYSYEDRYDPDKSLEFIGWCLNWMIKYSKYPIRSLHDLYACYNAGINADFKNNKDAQANADKILEMYYKYRKAYLNRE